MGGVYYPSISNEITGKIKYEQDFLDMLEKEIAGGLPSAFPPRKHDPNVISLLSSPEYIEQCFFHMGGRIYLAKVSHVMSISNISGNIGSCYKLYLGERKSQEEIDAIIANSKNLLSENRLIRYFQVKDYNRVRNPRAVFFDNRKRKEENLIYEINTPKCAACFTVIHEEDEDDIPVHKGQRIVPKRLTDTRMHFCGDSGRPYEFFSGSLDDLHKYPIVEIR